MPLQRIGPYELLEPLGRGAMGVVWRARHTGLGSTRALKVLARPGAGGAGRFEREARTLAAVRDPHVVAVHEAGTLPDGRPWLCMDLIEGRALDRVLAGGRLPLERALQLAADLARGVAALHRANVVHRDLKPQNVLVDEGGRAIVVDLGLALAPESDERLTRTGALLGTLRMMAPEQLRGERTRQGPWTDVWALGLLLYELLTGAPAWDLPEEGPPLAIVGEAMQARRPRPSDRDPDLPAALDALVVRAIALEPAARFADAGAFLAALEAVRAAPGPTRRALRRRRRAALAAGIGLGGLAVGLAVGAQLLARGQAPRVELRAERPAPDPARAAAPAPADGPARPVLPAAYEAGDEPLVAVSPHEGTVEVAFLAGGLALSAGHLDRRLRAWQVSEAGLAPAGAWDLPEGPAALLETPEGVLVLLRGNVLRADGRREPTLLPLELPLAARRRLTCGAVSPDGRLLALAEVSRSDQSEGEPAARVLLLPLSGGPPLWIGPRLELPVQALGFSPTGEELIEASGDSMALEGSTLRVRDARTGQVRATVGLLVKPTCVLPGVEPGQVLVGSSSQHVLVCEPALGRIVTTFDGGAMIADSVGLDHGVGNAAHAGAVRAMLRLPDGRLVTVCNEGPREPPRNELRVWDPVRRALLRPPLLRRESWPARLAAAREGRWVLVGDDKGRLELWDASAWPPLTR